MGFFFLFFNWVIFPPPHPHPCPSLPLSLFYCSKWDRIGWRWWSQMHVSSTFFFLPKSSYFRTPILWIHILLVLGPRRPTLPLPHSHQATVRSLTGQLAKRGATTPLMDRADHLVSQQLLVRGDVFPAA